MPQPGTKAVAKTYAAQPVKKVFNPAPPPPAIFPIGGRPDGEPSSGGAVPRLEDEAGINPAHEDGAPEGFASEAEFLQHWSKVYTDDYGADKHNIDEGLEDLRFIYVDQWDSETRAEREDAGKPCLTINTLPQFIGQVVGDRRINKAQIKVLADTNASVREAEVRGGIIRSIERASRAEFVYDNCCEDQVGCGISNFQITMEYARNDVFEQDIFIRPLDNPFSVVWDRFSQEPTGRDAKHCFVEERQDRVSFIKEYPDAVVPGRGVGEFNFGEDQDGDDVKLLALWRMVERPATYALFHDGSVVDVTGLQEAQYSQNLFVDEKGQAYVRKGLRTYAQRWLICATAILEGPYELPLSRLPIIRVMGRVGRVGTKKYRYGLVRWARDPSLMRNYWRSIAVETLAMAPKAQWIADHASVKGREEDFREAHLTGDPLLVYNTGKQKPERVQQPELPAAVLNESAMNTQDLKDVTGLHDASLGIQSNEVSGKAIMARQREGDVATVTYHDNLNMSIQEGGSVINELFPICYDSIRTARVLGADDKPEFVKLNDPNDPEAVNITDGKYDTTIVTGPSFTTQRLEAAESMLEMTKVMPELMAQAADLIVEAQDWPGAERIVKRFKKIIPAAQAEEAEEQAKQGQPPQPSPEEQQAAQLQEMQGQLASAEMQAQMQEMQLRIQEATAKTAEAEARAAKAKLEIEQAEEKIRQMRAAAETAEAKAIQAHAEIGFAAEEHETSQREAEQNMQRANDEHVLTQARASDEHELTQQRAEEVHQDAQRRGQESHVVDNFRKLNPPEKPGSDSNSGGGSRSANDSRP